MSVAVLQWGSLALRSNLFLSPLAGYTNLPFRRVVRELGGVDLCTTDLVNARSLIERNPKALKLIESGPEDRPPRRLGGLGFMRGWSRAVEGNRGIRPSRQKAPRGWRQLWRSGSVSSHQPDRTHQWATA